MRMFLGNVLTIGKRPTKLPESGAKPLRSGRWACPRPYNSQTERGQAYLPDHEVWNDLSDFVDRFFAKGQRNQ